MKRIVHGLLVFLLLGMPTVLWAASTPHEAAHAHGGSPAEEALEHATEALDRFRDVAVAQAEGYAHYDGRDTFMMGEHWVNRQILRSGQCELTRPSHLQYLVLDGQRTLIGVGYVCPGTPETPAPRLFGTDVPWHTHGPALCTQASGGPLDMQAWAEALPNALTPLTWQELCRQWGG